MGLQTLYCMRSEDEPVTADTLLNVLLFVTVAVLAVVVFLKEASK